MKLLLCGSMVEITTKASEAQTITIHKETENRVSACVGLY